jgi:RNA polymerase sigma factor (sigma-70 family)
MATARLRGFINHLRGNLAAPDGADRQLLARFVEQRDEAAFAELVARHGSLVFGVCERLLGHRQDAEDAFQATFLLLARKAGSVRWTDTAAPWLYEVARRTALEARAVRSRRRAREAVMSEVPHPEVQPAEPQDWRLVLDEEISRLPEKYRVAVVLCELQGRSRKEAAGMVGVPEGTLSWRLAAARKMLAERLGRRGVTLSGVALATGTAVPPALVESTVQTVMLVSAGVESAVAGPAVALMQEVSKVMLMKKLKLVVAVVLVLGAMGAGGFLYVEKPARAQAQAQAAKPPTDLDVLRKEVELLRMRLQVVEAELRELKGPAKQVKKPQPVHQLLEEFARLVKQGKYAEAELAAEKALKREPDNATAREALERLKNFKKATKNGDPRRSSDLVRWRKKKLDEQASLAEGVEIALKMLKEAKDDKSRAEAAEMLERATKKLQEHLRGPGGRIDPFSGRPR